MLKSEGVKDPGGAGRGLICDIGRVMGRELINQGGWEVRVGGVGLASSRKVTMMTTKLTLLLLLLSAPFVISDRRLLAGNYHSYL